MRGLDGVWGNIRREEKGGGGGLGPKSLLRQKWPNQIFPIVNFGFLTMVPLVWGARPMVVGCLNVRVGWRLAVGGWRLVAVRGWRLVAVGGWRLAVGGWWRFAVGGW